MTASFRRSIMWLYAGQAVTFVASFLSLVILSRLLTPREMGIFAIATATIGALQVFTSLGVGNYIIRERELDPRLLDSAFTINAILSLLLAGATLVSSILVAIFVNEPNVEDALRILAIGPLLGIPEFRHSVMLQRDMRFKLISSVTILRTVISTGVTLVTAILGSSYMSLVYGNITFTIVGVVALNLRASEHTSFRVSFHDWRNIAGFGLRMLSISGVSVLAMRLAEITLGRVLGLAALGLYSRANGLAMMIYQNIYATATRLVFSQMAKDNREKDSVKDTFMLGLQIITAIMWPISIGLAILSQPTVHLLLGPQWQGAAVPLAILMIAQFFGLCFAMNWELFVLRGDVSIQTRYEGLRSAIGLVAFAAGSLVSISVAALGRIVDAFVGMLLYLPHMSRLADTSSREFGIVYVQSAVLTLAAVFPSLLLMITTGWSPETSPAAIAIAVAIGASFWFWAAHWMRHPLADEARRLRGLLADSLPGQPA